MSDVIDINAERNRREQPDPEFVRKDEYGRPLYCYTLSYEMSDRRYCTDIWAYDFADAGNRVSAMRESLKLDGQIFHQIIA